MHFETLVAQPSDPILSMAAAFAGDRRVAKVDLGLGVYRDADGKTPVMAAVKAAEHQLVDAQLSKAYLGIDGDQGFVRSLEHLIFPHGAKAHVRGVQTVGGTGALRLAADLLAVERPGRTIWVGMPTWPNHAPVFRAAGLDVRGFSQLDQQTQALSSGALLEALHQAERGDVVLLHGCCHNPTGVDLPLPLWAEIGDIIAHRGLLPVVDMAYHGFGDGLDADAAGLHELIDRVPFALLAYSCSKNFALYRERVGALFVIGQGKAVDLAWSNLLPIARTSYSMPPDHGASVVRTILETPALARQWRDELAAMRSRVVDLRRALAAFGQAGPVDLGPLAHHKGFFSMLPLRPDQIASLRENNGVYIVPNGRANIAGLAPDQVGHLVDALNALE